METPQQNETQAPKPAQAAQPKKAPAKLPSKPISFSSQPQTKNGKKSGKATVNSQKKGGVNLMKKLSGM